MWSRRWTGLAGAGAVAAVTSVAVLLCAGAAPAAPAPGVPSPVPGTVTLAPRETAPHAAPARQAQSAQSARQTLNGPVVALGDSYTAGDLLPLSFTSRPPGCLRSAKSYAVQVAKALGASRDFVDAACGGAGVQEMTRPQRTYLGTNPPQLNALAPDDRLVMLTLGGDDLGFLNVLHTCMKLGLTHPFGSPCKSHYTSGGTDQLAARVAAEAGKMTSVFDDIRSRAPRARVVLVGYPDLFPSRGGCWPVVPITDGDIAYLRGIEMQFNGMLAQVAATAGATFVNTYAATAGHDFCQDENVRYMEGMVPGSLTAPFHPNARGQAAMAAAVLAALRA